jgi:hypothetical protein
VNAEQASKIVMWEPTRHEFGEGRCCGMLGERSTLTHDPTGVMATACLQTEIGRNTGNPNGGRSTAQLDAREGQAGPCGVADRLVVPSKPGNAGGGKEPDFGSVLEVVKNRESGHVAYNLHQRFGDCGRG